jgi:nucleoside-diphosphate-sugar epimerase
LHDDRRGGRRLEEALKILIVGGTGFVGGYTALYLQRLGHDVTLMSRSRPKGTSKLNDLPFVAGNYIEDDFGDGRLEGYDALVFGAGNDLGDVPRDGSTSQAAYFQKANIEALPRFFEAAKRAGVSRAVYMGSYYSFVAPQSIETIPYVRSRHLADEALRALSAPGFNVCSCALPWIVGYTPGFPVWQWETLTRYARGEFPDWPLFAPPGGANFMTCQSIAEALLGGLERGESGKAYLVGDANLTWKSFFERWFAAVGRPIDLPVRDDDHPVVPREVIAYVGGGFPSYEPPPAETERLGYRRGVLLPHIAECADYYASLPGR